MNASERQNILLAAAGKFLAGGGLGLFVLPPELNLVIARGRQQHREQLLFQHRQPPFQVFQTRYGDLHLRSQVTQRAGRLLAEPRQFRARCRRPVRLETVLDHGLPRDAPQSRPVIHAKTMAQR